MQINLSITEFKELCKSIQKRPKKLFKMMRQEIRETTGQYLSELIQMELTDFLGRCLMRGEMAIGIIATGIIIVVSH